MRGGLSANAAVKEAVKRVRQGNEIGIAALAEEIAPASILHEILSPYGFNSAQVEDIAHSMLGEGTKQFHTAKWSVIKERCVLRIIQKDIFDWQDTVLPESGSITTPQGILNITKVTFNGNIEKQHNVATLDADRLCLPLTLRNTRTGDRFAPFGMRGTKLVSDYLTDRKKSIIEKQKQLVITDAKGEIVWVVNERPSARCCINEKTKEVLRLEWSQ